ncbi:PAX3- and PAX7-binding protein 1 [Balamuthia mandrillaris]
MLPIRPRRKQLRKRVVGQEEEEEEEGKEEQTPQRQEEKEDEDSAAPVQRVEKKFNNRNKSRQQRREKKSSSALSFGDEEEVVESVNRKTAPFQTPQDVKKKDSSANPTRARKFMRAAKQPTTETATASSNERPSVIPASLLQRSQVGEYTPEKLAALRHNSNTFYFSGSVQPSRPSSHSSIAAERSTTTTTTMVMADAEKEDEEKSGGEFLYDAVPIIPKKEEIERARAKRERMRTYGNILTADEEAKEPGGNKRAEEEFIPLNSTRQDSKRVNQRLIRDSDSDSEEADGDDAVVFEDQAGNRIAFGDPKEMERRQKRLQRRSLYDEIERDRRREERQQKKASDEEEDEEEKDDSSEDEELERWELEQLKKGVRGKEVGSEAVELAMGAISMMDEEEGEDGVKMLMDEDGLFLQRPSSSNAAAAAAIRHGLREGVDAATAQAQAQARATPTVQQIVEKLKQGLNTMQLNTSKHEKKLQQIEDTLKTSATTIDTTQQRMDFLSQQYVYYQELKEYVLDLLDCLKEKMPQISEYDVEMDKIRLEHYVERKKARQREIEETIEDITKSKHSEERGSKKNVELDEFGRDKNAMEQTRKERRREMREKRRRERAERRPARQQEQEDEGWTSEEEDEDEEDYRQAMREYAVERDEILSLANGLFDDALPEFCSLLHIKRRFSYWLRNYSDDYLKSFAYISIADICAPLAMLETLAWDPFFLAHRGKERKQEIEKEEKPTTKEEAVWNSSFQRMNWYRLLEDYGKEEDAEIQQKEGEKEKDTMKKEEQEQQKVQGIHSSKDYALVSVLVRRVIVPKAKELFTHAWDPFSPSQTDFARTLLEQIMPHLRSEKEIKNICAPIVVTMQAAIQQVRVLPLLLEEDPSSPAYSLALSSFWRTLKLLKNIASFHKSLSNRALQALCLDKILNPELIPFLRKLETTLDNTHNPQTELLLVRMCERIMESFPSEWIHYNVGPTELLSSLLLFRELARRLAKRFSTMEEARRDVLLQRLTNVLKQLGDDNDTAMKLE